MSLTTNPTGNNNQVNPLTSGSSTPTYSERAQKGLSDVKDTLVAYTPKRVRESTVWSYLAWPFSTFGSLLSAIWARISKAVWGSHSIVTEEITLESKGFLWNSTYKISTEEAIRQGRVSIKALIHEGKLTMEDAQIRGWIPVTIKGTLWNSTMLLKDAIEGRYMTVDDAIKAEHITDSQAKQAPWLKQVTPEKK
jgi:hypothetical protein